MRTILLAIVLLAAMPTQAQLTGLMLEEQCKSEEGTSGFLACMAYFAGYSEASAIWREATVAAEYEVPPFMPCPETVNRQVMIRVWLKFIEENPEKLEETPRWSILQAMIESFPCRK